MRVPNSLLCVCISLFSLPVQADEPLAALTEAQSERVTKSVDAGLEWLAENQQGNGSFRGPKIGQPGITSLGVLAFMSAGHLPGEGEYGTKLERALEYALSCELDPGFFCASEPAPVWQFHQASHTGTYNQAITGLMFSELAGQLEGKLGKKVSTAVERALAQSERTQFRTVPRRPQDQGGWRYPQPNREDFWVTDLSITAWQITFLRSAKNAGYDVDEKMVAAAHKYVKGLFQDRRGTFTYNHYITSRGMTGAGIMSLAMLGDHKGKEANSATKWLLEKPFQKYGERVGQLDRFHYSVYYCTQAMYQRGGKDWEEFYPQIVNLLVSNQTPDGNWQPEAYEKPFGESYVTSMSVLALTPPYAMLPIHQR